MAKNTMILRILLTVIVSLMLAAVSGCKTEPPASLYDPAYTSGAQPTVTSLSPAAGSAAPNTPLAGVTTITITGSNFSPVKASNLVFFDGMRAPVLEASPTQLKVTAPLLVKDSIKVKVAVFGSELFSEPLLYKLEDAASQFGNLGTLEEPFGLAVDNLGNVYVSMLANGLVDSTYQITPDGVRRSYSRGLSSAVPRWSAMKMGPGGLLYTSAIGRSALFRIPAGGGVAAIWQNAGGLGLVADFDFDQDGNVWAGGLNPAIYRVTPARNIKPFTFNADVRSVRVFDGYVYVGGRTFPDSLERIVRFQRISSDSLGPREDYFNFSAAYPAAKVYAITFSSDGDLFVGTDASAGSIVVVKPNRTSSVLYPGVLKAQSMTFSYGTGVHLFVSRTGTAANNADKKIIKVNVLKPSAPYYGRM